MRPLRFYQPTLTERLKLFALRLYASLCGAYLGAILDLKGKPHLVVTRLVPANYKQPAAFLRVHENFGRLGHGTPRAPTWKFMVCPPHPSYIPEKIAAYIRNISLAAFRLKWLKKTDGCGEMHTNQRTLL